jgi:hypothetical protein
MTPARRLISSSRSRRAQAAGASSAHTYCHNGSVSGGRGRSWIRSSAASSASSSRAVGSTVPSRIRPIRERGTRQPAAAVPSCSVVRDGCPACSRCRTRAQASAVVERIRSGRTALQSCRARCQDSVGRRSASTAARCARSARSTRAWAAWAGSPGCPAARAKASTVARGGSARPDAARERVDAPVPALPGLAGAQGQLAVLQAALGFEAAQVLRQLPQPGQPLPGTAAGCGRGAPSPVRGGAAHLVGSGPGERGQRGRRRPARRSRRPGRSRPPPAARPATGRCARAARRNTGRPTGSRRAGAGAARTIARCLCTLTGT